MLFNLKNRYGYVFAAAMFTFISPASATFICTDEWGGSYLLEQEVKPGLIKLKCISDNPSARSTRSSKGVNSIGVAALALGISQPVERLPSGDLSLAVIQGTALAPVSRPSKSMAPLETMINEIADQYGHDANLLKAIIHVESRFNANAVSPKGAIGLMQVMPSTGSSLGVEEPKKTLFDPQTNVRAGAKFLRILMDKFSDRPELAIAAYNAGEGAVMRYKRDIPPYPETQSYVRQVFAQYHFYQKQ
jgi:hypothetical protein